MTLPRIRPVPLFAVLLSVVASELAHAQPGVMLMNRIGPSASTLHIANADGSGERRLFADLELRLPRLVVTRRALDRVHSPSGPRSGQADNLPRPRQTARDSSG